MKLLHRVVKSSQGLNFLGTVSIDNTVVIKPRKPQTEAIEPENLSPEEQKIRTEVENRLASLQRELSEKEKAAFEEANLQKSTIITEAMQEAEKIRKEARTNALIESEKAKQKAYDEGFSQGMADARAQEEKYLRAAAALISELNSKKEALYIQNENDILDLVYEMVEKITNSEINTNGDIVLNIAKQAAKSFRNSDYVKISLAKSDVSEKIKCDEKLIRRIAGNIPDVEIELLSEAKQGTVILDNDKEIIDASVPTQLDLLKEIMENSKQQTTL